MPAARRARAGPGSEIALAPGGVITELSAELPRAKLAILRQPCWSWPPPPKASPGSKRSASAVVVLGRILLPPSAWLVRSAPASAKATSAVR
jgi:hypothetical protein